MNNEVFSTYRARYGMSDAEYARRYNEQIKTASADDFIILALHKHDHLIHMAERQGKRRAVRYVALRDHVRPWLDLNTPGWSETPSDRCNWFLEMRFASVTDAVHFTLKWL
jgi:hypothetical protein